MTRKSRIITTLLSVAFVLTAAISYAGHHQPPAPFHSNGALVHFTE